MVNLKRKEFIIYAIALMLVTAGYFNYLNFDFKSIKTSVMPEKNDIDEISDNGQLPEENDLKEDEKDKKENNSIWESENEGENQIEVSSNEKEEETNNNKTNIGDAVLVSSNETIDNTSEVDDYYATTKLQRNQMYAEIIKKYEDLINNQNLSEVQKSMATEEITKINNKKNAIMICENLILSKDFEDCVILINEESVNIVVHVKDGLNQEKVSQIQNIISRELSTEIENIHISEK